jgi:hypothetical protein
MPERASKSQRIQFGYEAAYDAGATVNRRLQALTVDFDPQAERTPNLAQGYNFPSSTTMGKDFTEGDLGGALVFDELQDLFTMTFGQVVPTAMVPATAMAWEWNLPNSGDITPKSAKFEKGDASTGESVNGVVVTDLDISWDREGFDVGGSVMGTRLNESAVMTSAGVVARPQVSLDPGKIGVFIDTATGALGTSRMVRAFEGGFSFGGLFGQIWPLNETKTSYDGIISLAPDSESTILLMADAAGKALLTSLRNGDRRYLRWRVIGPQIGAGPATYLFQVDLAIEVVDVASFDDSDGIYAIPFTFALMADETWGKAGVIRVQNTIDSTTL